jgi:hypothetical protein
MAATRVPVCSMAPAWRRILKRHLGKTLIEFCRRPQIEERIAGFVVGFSSELILLHRFDWNTYTLDGYTILRDADIKQKRIFSRKSYWQTKAIQKSKIRPHALLIRLASWEEAVGDIAQKFPLIHVERECWIGFPIEVNSQKFVIDNLSPSAEWTGPYRMKTADVTRVDFGGGYERALALTAPKRSAKKRGRSSPRSSIKA